MRPSLTSLWRSEDKHENKIFLSSKVNLKLFRHIHQSANMTPPPVRFSLSSYVERCNLIKWFVNALFIQEKLTFWSVCRLCHVTVTAQLNGLHGSQYPRSTEKHGYNPSRDQTGREHAEKSSSGIFILGMHDVWFLTMFSSLFIDVVDVSLSFLVLTKWTWNTILFKNVHIYWANVRKLLQHIDYYCFQAKNTLKKKPESCVEAQFSEQIYRSDIFCRWN